MCEVAGAPRAQAQPREQATYAGAHLLASIPNALFASQAYGSLLADDVIEGASPLPYRDGRLAVPVGPGLGVVLDDARVGAYADAYRSGPDGYPRGAPRGHGDAQFRERARMMPTFWLLALAPRADQCARTAPGSLGPVVLRGLEDLARRPSSTI